MVRAVDDLCVLSVQLARLDGWNFSTPAKLTMDARVDAGLAEALTRGRLRQLASSIHRADYPRTVHIAVSYLGETRMARSVNLEMKNVRTSH